MRHTGLYVLVGSIALNAALGIYAIAAAGFGKLEVKILVTSLGVSGASMLALACVPALERRRLGPVPRCGIAAACGGFVLLTASVWNEFDVKPLWKAAWTLAIVAVAAAHASLLALARLAPRFRWALVGAVGLGFTFSGLAVSLVWGEWSDSDAFGRSVGVVAVLFAAFTILVPVLHRASRSEFGPLGASGPPSVHFCPRCGRPASVAVDGVAACTRCGVRFSVRFLEPGSPIQARSPERALRLRS